jgi:hypothetical protein
MKLCIVKPEMRRIANGKSRKLRECTVEKRELKKNGTIPAEDRTVCIHDNASLLTLISYN